MVPVHLPQRIQTLLERIESIKTRASRSSDEITVVAVAKGQSLEKIQTAVTTGIRNFGENYVQEAVPKIMQIGMLAPLATDDTLESTNHKSRQSIQSLQWHFIGRIQSNKAKEIATHFDFVQSLETVKHAKLLHDARPKRLPALNICVQVNLPGITHPIGVIPEKLFQFIEDLTSLERLNIRGLMFILQESISCAALDQQRNAFRKCHELFLALKNKYAFLDTLSMGMSNDFEAAIFEGSTMLRIGTALFGERGDRI